MFVLNSSSIEYQGLSVIKKDCRMIQLIVNQYYKNVSIRENLHLCLQYFGNTKKIDDCISKQEDLIPSNCIGRQITFPIIGIGDYRKNGKIMNIALLVDTNGLLTTQLPNGKTLYDYLKNDYPNITVYTREEKWTDEQGRIRPVTSAKKSSKCFDSTMLKDGETNNFIMFDEPIMITAQIAMFYRTNAAYHINMNAPRLITKSALKDSMNEIMNFDYDTAKLNEQKKIDDEKLNHSLSEASKIEQDLFGL